jgi:quercetin dioxygenase-like cupin family protein
MRVVRFSSAEPEQAGPGVQVRKLIAESLSDEVGSYLGYSQFSPGIVSEPLLHDCEELAFVTKGYGELRGDGGVVPFVPFDSLHIPRGTWHWIANTGDVDVEMAFFFPTPDRPRTERRSGADSIRD